MSKIQKLSIEELLEIASTDGRSVSNLSQDKSNVRDYIMEQGIKDGDILVPNFLIYYYYRKLWKPQGNKLSKIGFLRKFSVVFTSYRNRNTRYYKLNEEAFNLSEETINEAKQFDERYRNKVSKKRNEKKQRKISRASKEIQSEDETGLY